LDMRNLCSAALYCVLCLVFLKSCLNIRYEEQQTLLQSDNTENVCINENTDFLVSTTLRDTSVTSVGISSKSKLSTFESQNTEMFRSRVSRTSSREPSVRIFRGSLLVALVWLVFPFIPATNLFFYVGFVVAERVLYIPSMGFCLLVSLGAEALRARGSALGGRLVTIMVGSLVITYSLRTIIRNEDWRSEHSLYQSGVAVNPAKGKIKKVFMCYTRILLYRAHCFQTSLILNNEQSINH
jgi:protein O-mannosyl-transferase